MATPTAKPWTPAQARAVDSASVVETAGFYTSRPVAVRIPGAMAERWTAAYVSPEALALIVVQISEVTPLQGQQQVHPAVLIDIAPQCRGHQSERAHGRQQSGAVFKTPA